MKVLLMSVFILVTSCGGSGSVKYRTNFCDKNHSHLRNLDIIGKATKGENSNEIEEKLLTICSISQETVTNGNCSYNHMISRYDYENSRWEYYYSIDTDCSLERKTINYTEYIN